MFHLEFWIHSCYTNDSNLVHISDLSYWVTNPSARRSYLVVWLHRGSQPGYANTFEQFIFRKVGANYKLERHQCKQTKDKFLHCFTPALVKVGETSLIVRWGPGWVAVGFSLIYVNRFSCSNHLMRILVCKTYGRQHFHFKWYTQKFHFAFLNSYK